LTSTDAWVLEDPTRCDVCGSDSCEEHLPAAAAAEQHEAVDTWPAPLSARAYHGIFGELVNAIAPQTEADPAALLMQLLSMFGNNIGRSAHWRAEADIHYLNLYTVLVGATAKGRKGTAGGRIKQVYDLVDPEWSARCCVSGLSSGEGLIWVIRDPIEKQVPIKIKGRSTGEYETVIEDHGVEDKRLHVVESEFASTLRVLGRDGNTLSALIRLAWDGQILRAMTKNAPAMATGPHISLIGHITKDELRRDLDRIEAAFSRRKNRRRAD